jgi:hypothetical protein
MNSATHMRHKCLDNREAPETRPFTISLASPMLANVPIRMNT